jgi:hypothetical protein
MSNLQLLLSPGIPCLLLCVSMLNNHIRFTRLDRGFDRMDKRADTRDERAGGVDKWVDKSGKQTEAREARFDRLDNELQAFRLIAT